MLCAPGTKWSTPGRRGRSSTPWPGPSRSVGARQRSVRRSACRRKSPANHRPACSTPPTLPSSLPRRAEATALAAPNQRLISDRGSVSRPGPADSELAFRRIAAGVGLDERLGQRPASSCGWQLPVAAELRVRHRSWKACRTHWRWVEGGAILVVLLAGVAVLAVVGLGDLFATLEEVVLGSSVVAQAFWQWCPPNRTGPRWRRRPRTARRRIRFADTPGSLFTRNHASAAPLGDRSRRARRADRVAPAHRVQGGTGVPANQPPPFRRRSPEPPADISRTLRQNDP